MSGRKKVMLHVGEDVHSSDLIWFHAFGSSFVSSMLAIETMLEQVVAV